MNFSIYIYFVAFYDEALTCQKVVVCPGRDDQGEGEEGGGGAQHRDTVLLCHVSRSRVRHNVCLGITGGRGWARQ